MRQTLGAKEVVERDAQDIDCRTERFARPVPCVQDLGDAGPVVQVAYAPEEVREDNDVVERNGHSTLIEKKHRSCE